MKKENGYYIWQRDEHIQVAANFWLHEFICGCGKDHEQKMSIDTIERLQRFRDLLNEIASRLMGIDKEIKIVITPGHGCRCDEFNLESGGKPDSQHRFPYPTAVDFKIIGIPKINYDKASYLAHGVGFTGLGIGKTFMHLDTRSPKGLHLGVAKWYY